MEQTAAPKRDKIVTLLDGEATREQVLIKGWVRTRRDSKGFSFFEINDGSCLRNIQVIVDAGIGNYSEAKDLGTGAAIAVEGKLVASPGSGQPWEIQADRITVIGTCPEDSLCKRNGIPTNSCAPLPTCGRGPINTARCSACGRGLRMLFTNFSKTAVSTISIPRS